MASQTSMASIRARYMTSTPNLSLNSDAPRRRASPPSFVAPVSLVR